MKRYSSSRGLPDLPRRRFIQGLAAGGALLGLSPELKPLRASETIAGTATGTAPILAGTEFELTVAYTPVNFTGAPRLATTINGSMPGPTLRWREGDTVSIRVTNRLNEPTSIHWHGILLPYEMDGVPGGIWHGIAPGETFVYYFKVKQAGTYWYHAHTLHEQTGLFGAIIIDPAAGDAIRSDRDYVVQLSDWIDDDPMTPLLKLKKQSDYYNYHRPTAVDFFHDVSTLGFAAALDKRRMWNRMRMSPADLSDISGHAYTYLMNGTPPTGNWTGLFRPGERVRLRFINAGTATFFDVRMPGLVMSVVQADGQNVDPVAAEEFRIGPGETYDVIVTPNDGAYTIFAQAMDRSGYARGTLATGAGMTAAVPSLDPPEWLSMTDMMGDVQDAQVPREPGMAGAANMEQDGMAGMAGMEGMQHGDMPMDGAVNVRHAASEYGPAVDMRVDTPRINLDDPGVGLRNNGRHVLTYADLSTLGGALDPREPEREIELHLTGNMERYTWSIDGLELGKSTPIHLREGERVRVIMHNDTMMTHPMHLHGMWCEMEDEQGKFLVRKHTINVQPAQRITFRMTADAPGRWPWHCHLLYHMAAGMFRVVVVA